MTTILFFDDQLLNRRENVVRRVGQPRLVPESVYRDPLANTHWGYPTVFRDKASGKWRMIYQGKNEHRHNISLLAESDDGLSWALRDTTADIDLPDRRYPNQLLPLDHHGGMHCYVDPFAEPAERIKGPMSQSSRADLWVSPDGLHWSLKEGVQWHRRSPDPLTAAFWNAVRGTYVLTTRPEGGDRRISLSETADWQSFTEPELALQADALDSPLTEPYGMPVYPYEGYYVGLLWLYHVAPEVEGHSPHKYFDGHVDCQLAYSLNGWHFQRTLRDPFIPNGDPGEPDAGCVYPSAPIQREDGSLLIYACACTHEHGYIPPGSGSLLAYRLRRDGFVCLESGGGVGTIGTRPLYWRGGEVALNVQSQGGEARAQVTDPAGAPLEGYAFGDCEPFSGDDTAWQPNWKDGKMLDALSGSAIRLEVELKSARLFAIRGDFEPVFGRRYREFSVQGIVPEPRIGF